MPKQSLQNQIHRIIYGDVFSALSFLENNSIDCSITSPPYWSQRDYGFSYQIGNEKTFEEYIRKLITIFRALKEKLNEKGIFYLNIGDKYINKYGHTSLGMIPYKLAYYMVQDGWILEDIIIWYKPNHMPSSVKNRFTNTYEPIFVFSKASDNYYRVYKEDHKISNFLRIPLQPSKYSHVAPYPEKLVESLIQLGIPKDGLIVDPFAGSGTTCKAVLNLNQNENYQMKSIMVEAQENYIQIIQDRCKISNNNIIKMDNIGYNLVKTNFEPVFLGNNVKSKTQIYPKDLNTSFVHICKDHTEYENLINLLCTKEFFETFPDDGVIFFGLPDHEIEKIYTISSIPKWIIRNMLIVPVKEDWTPIFMLVKDVKSTEYHFNIESIRSEHRYSKPEDWNKIDFVGYKVIQNAICFNKPLSGIISRIISIYNDGMPHWVEVIWSNSTKTIEEVINPFATDRNAIYRCPKCLSLLKKYYHSQKEVKCPSCNLLLWRDISSIPTLEINPREIPNLSERIDNNTSNLSQKVTKDYQGKFKNTSKVNMGQSPGARSSTSEWYFSVQRYFDVKQAMISDYLNLHRISKGLTKKQIIEIFPSRYKHTVGHWLRKDMGGSLPKEEDLMKLKEILKLDNVYIEFINRKGLKLQTVLISNSGKNPGDFLDYPQKIVIQMLEKAIS